MRLKTNIVFIVMEMGACLCRENSFLLVDPTHGVNQSFANERVTGSSPANGTSL